MINAHAVLAKILDQIKTYELNLGTQAAKDQVAVLMSPQTWKTLLKELVIEGQPGTVKPNPKEVFGLSVILGMDVPPGHTYFTLPDSHRFLDSSPEGHIPGQPFTYNTSFVKPSWPVNHLPPAAYQSVPKFVASSNTTLTFPLTGTVINFEDTTINEDDDGDGLDECLSG